VEGEGDMADSWGLWPPHARRPGVLDTATLRDPGARAYPP